MGRAPCCEKQGLKRGPWTAEEDELLVEYMNKNGHGSWRSLPKLAGLLRCGKSCRLRWTNYLRPDIKRGPFTIEEEKTIMQMHSIFGNRWAAIASQLSGRTDNEIKNFWNSHLRKRLVERGLDPHTHAPFSPSGLNVAPSASPSTRHMAQWESDRLEAEAQLSNESLLSGPSQPSSRVSSNKPNCDFFLRIWNSEVGKSFQRLAQDTSSCQSPSSQASSSTKCAEGSLTTTDRQPANAVASTTTSELHEEMEHGDGSLITSDVKPANAGAFTTIMEQQEKMEKKSYNLDRYGNDMVGGSDSSSSDINDCSDISLQLLLDYPTCDEISFFQGHITNYSMLWS